jgi:hypothetical protein
MMEARTVMQVSLRENEAEGCSCGQVEDHPVAWRRTVDGWAVVGWSLPALVLEASVPEPGAVVYRAVVFAGGADRVLGPGPKGRPRRMRSPAPPVGEGVGGACS